MTNTNFQEIDGNRLRVALDSWCAENNTSIYKLSTELGYSQIWLYDICKRGNIRKNAVKLLMDYCGIKYEDYKILPKKEEPEEPEKPADISVEEAMDTNEFTEEDKVLFKELFDKLERIAVAMEKQTEIQEKNSQNLETIINMLK